MDVLTLISRLRCCEKAVDARRGTQRMVAPFARTATPQTQSSRINPSGRGDLGALLWRKPLAVACTAARLTSRMASQIALVADAKSVLARPLC